MIRSGMGGWRLAAGVAVTHAALLACAAPAAAQLTSEDRAALGDLAPAFAESFGLQRGWYRGQAVQYYDFGPQDVTISPLIIPVRGFSADGAPLPVANQQPIFSSIPGIAGYSAIWQVQYVVVGPSYRANTLRDGRTAIQWTLAGRARLVVPGTYVNCPIVPAGSSLEGDPDARALRTAWYKGMAVSYFDFGLTAPDPAPIYAFVSGFDGDAPQFLRAQANLIDVVPDGTGGVPELWDVMFVEAPAGYVPDTIRDVSALGGLPRRAAGTVRNCPVVIIDGRRAPRRPLMPSG